MKRIIGLFLGVAVVLAVSGISAEAAVVYTSKASFDLVTGNNPTHLNQFTDFNIGGALSGPTGDSLVYADQKLTIGGATQNPNTGITSPAYTISSLPDEAQVFGLNGSVAGMMDTLLISIPTGTWAVGGDFSLTDSSGNFGAGTLKFNLSDSSSFSLPLTGIGEFRGFSSTTSLITSVEIFHDPSAPDYDPNFYPTVDNLYVVPEPSVVMMNLAVVVGAGAVYRIRRSRKQS